jgi:tocopherol O-methyltransferase
VIQETRVSTNQSSDPEVVAYYDTKTTAIMKRYGPGPRVHYHTGLVDDLASANFSKEELRQRLVNAQERTLSHAANVWDASSNLSGDVLDVGCGLGGGAIFWAQEFGARVTAVTCVESHVDWVSRLAMQAGVESRVQPLLCDALEVPGENCFDAAVAVDSSCHLSRNDWFRRLASLLRPGGRVFIIDCFLGRPEYEDPFNSYWHTRIGTIDEYDAAASESGLRRELLEDISHRAEHFWTLTLALIEAEALERQADQVEAIRLESSRRAHSVVRKGLRDGGLRYALMSFSKKHR